MSHRSTWVASCHIEEHASRHIYKAVASREHPVLIWKNSKRYKYINWTCKTDVVAKLHHTNTLLYTTSHTHTHVYTHTHTHTHTHIHTHTLPYKTNMSHRSPLFSHGRIIQRYKHIKQICNTNAPSSRAATSYRYIIVHDESCHTYARAIPHTTSGTFTHMRPLLAWQDHTNTSTWTFHTSERAFPHMWSSTFTQTHPVLAYKDH